MILRCLEEKERIDENGNHENWGTWPKMFWIEVEDEK